MELTRIFDEKNQNWNQQLEFNLLFLRGIENHMNQMLRIKGYVFFNDLMDVLHMPRTREGQKMGWRRDIHNANHPNQVRLNVTSDRENQSVLVEFLGLEDILDVLDKEQA